MSHGFNSKFACNEFERFQEFVYYLGVTISKNFFNGCFRVLCLVKLMIHKQLNN